LSSRGELMGELTLALREVRGRLAGVLHSVGEHVDLGLIEMDFLDLISRTAPVTPGELATTTGLSPATVTGILDRLEQGGWIRRTRDLEDRRKVIVDVEMKRAPELGRLYGGMLARLHDILEQYSDEQLAVLLGFLKQVRDAGDVSVEELRAALR
jgi:DNA-binding MarR family transcriptional regulator